MKKLLTFALFLTIIASLSANDLTERNLKGKITSLTSEEYSFVKDSGLWKKDSLKSKVFNSYLSNGYFSYENVEYFGAESSQSYSKLYNYDGFSTRISKVKWQNDLNQVIWEEYIYNPKRDNVAYVLCFLTNRMKLYSESYVYNDLGYRIQATRLSGSNKPIAVDTKKGSWTEGATKLTYSYNSQGEKTEVIGYNSDNSVKAKITYIYDSSSNITEETEINADGTVNSKTSYSYDTYNNVISKIVCNADNSEKYKETYTYEYDVAGNWTKKRILKSTLVLGESIEVSVTEIIRNIKY